MLNRRTLIGAALALPAMLPAALRAEDAALPVVRLGIPPDTQATPLFLAAETGLFRKAGIAAEFRPMLRADRIAALAAGTLDGVVGRLDAVVGWAAAGHTPTQVALLERSRGGIGLVGLPGSKLAELRGKRIACPPAGSAPNFFLLYVLHQAGIPLAEVTLVAPVQDASALAADRVDAAVLAGPQIPALRNAPDKAAVLATTLDYPVVAETLCFAPSFLAARPEAVRAVVGGWFDALAAVASDPDAAYAAMGRSSHQDAVATREMAGLIEWPTRARARAIMVNDLPGVLKDAGTLLAAAGVIAAAPDMGKTVDTQFLGA